MVRTKKRLLSLQGSPLRITHLSHSSEEIRGGPGRDLKGIISEGGVEGAGVGVRVHVLSVKPACLDVL